MCEMESNFLSSSLSGVSFCQTEPWARSWDPAHSFRQERARFQQKQLQEKEEKLLKLYEEQQERAMNRVGGRVHSGGSSVSSGSSTVGGGKVRHMFQSRRGYSESKQGRDRSYPLEPLKPIRTQSLEVEGLRQKGSWSNASRTRLNRHNSDLQLRRVEDCREEDARRTVRRTQSQVRQQQPKSKLFYFGGSHTDLRFSDESDYVQTFQVVDDHYEIPDRDPVRESRYKEDDYFVENFHDKRQFYEDRLRSDGDLARNDPYERLPEVGMDRGKEQERTGRYKTFVSQKPFAEKPHLGRRTEATSSPPPPPRHINGNVVSPVMKVRKATPMPATVAPKQHLLQTRRSNVPLRHGPGREVAPPIPASRTTVTRPTSGMPQSEKPPIGRKTARPAQARPSPQSELPSCQFCGRHFTEDRIAKHQEICKKSSKSKRKPFDSVKQRVKGTEAEQFLKGGKPRGQPQKQLKAPQKDWRKTHEDFINSIRAAREYQASTIQSRKPASIRSSAVSRY